MDEPSSPQSKLHGTRSTAEGVATEYDPTDEYDPAEYDTTESA